MFAGKNSTDECYEHLNVATFVHALVVKLCATFLIIQHNGSSMKNTFTYTGRPQVQQP